MSNRSAESGDFLRQVFAGAKVPESVGDLGTKQLLASEEVLQDCAAPGAEVLVGDERIVTPHAVDVFRVAGPFRGQDAQVGIAQDLTGQVAVAGLVLGGQSNQPG